jgi:hypothetical protein
VELRGRERFHLREGNARGQRDSVNIKKKK